MAEAASRETPGGPACTEGPAAPAGIIALGGAEAMAEAAAGLACAAGQPLRVVQLVPPDGLVAASDALESGRHGSDWYVSAVLECARCGKRTEATFALPDSAGPPPPQALRGRPREAVYVVQHIELPMHFFTETDDFFDSYAEGEFRFPAREDGAADDDDVTMRVTPLPLKGTVRSVVLVFDPPRAGAECFAAVAAETEARELVWFTSERKLVAGTRTPVAAACAWLAPAAPGERPKHVHYATLPSIDPEVFLDFVEARLA